VDYPTTHSEWSSLYGHAPPTQDEYDKFDNVIFTSDVTWDPTVLDDKMDLTVPNENLFVDIDEEYYDARSLDTGEKSTQCIILQDQ